MELWNKLVIPHVLWVRVCVYVCMFAFWTATVENYVIFMNTMTNVHGCMRPYTLRRCAALLKYIATHFHDDY